MAGRSFALKILAIHAVLLAVVLALVAEAAAQIYSSTRDEQRLEAKIRQELLADQTRHGIENYYQSVLEDLKWLAVSSPAASRPADLGDRVAAVFYYDQRTGDISPVLSGVWNISPDMRDWLAGVKGDQVSRFMVWKDGGASLVATPDPDGRRLLVAIVPGSKIEAEWLPLLTDQEATLLDSHLAVITSSSRQLGVANLFDIQDVGLREMAEDYRNHQRPMSRVFEQPLAITGGAQISPRLITLTPVQVAGDQWALLLGAPLEGIDSGVGNLLRTTITWAAFVAVSIAAILASTGIQLIRYRGRVERVRNQAMRREMEQARQIQLNWLPEARQIDPAMQLAAVNHPASHVSGDFYNWFTLDDGRHVITIGDVSGHGMTAAFLMATTQLLVRQTMARLRDTGSAMEEINRQLCSQKFQGQYVTMLLLVLDLPQGKIEFASAGHPAPLLSEANGPFIPASVPGQYALGLDPAVRYVTQTLALRGPTCLLLYTDGVTDALGSNGQRYSTDQLIAALRGPFSSAQSVIDTAVRAVDEFRNGRELDDDLTLVSIELRQLPAGVSPPSVALAH